MATETERNTDSPLYLSKSSLEMKLIFEMFMESLILRVSCKVSEALLHVNFARDPKYS